MEIKLYSYYTLKHYHKIYPVLIKIMKKLVITQRYWLKTDFCILRFTSNLSRKHHRNGSSRSYNLKNDGWCYILKWCMNYKKETRNKKILIFLLCRKRSLCCLLMKVTTSTALTAIFWRNRLHCGPIGFQFLFAPKTWVKSKIRESYHQTMGSVQCKVVSSIMRLLYLSKG